MTPGLRDHKSASLRIAEAESLPEDMRPLVREILSLQATNPRKGHATTLLWTVCHEADQSGITLMLQPKRFSDGMDDDKLRQFYGRFGFVEFQAEPVVLMARSPVTKQLVTLQ